MKKLLRITNQAKLQSNLTAPRYKFGYELPRNNLHETAVLLDKKNNNTKSQDAITSEITQQHEYNTYKDLGKDGKPPPDYKRLRVHFVFDVKHDGRHKA